MPHQLHLIVQIADKHLHYVVPILVVNGEGAGTKFILSVSEYANLKEKI